MKRNAGELIQWINEKIIRGEIDQNNIYSSEMEIPTRTNELRDNISEEITRTAKRLFVFQFLDTSFDSSSVPSFSAPSCDRWNYDQKEKSPETRQR